MSQLDHHPFADRPARRALAAVLDRRTLPLVASVAVCGLIYGYAAWRYPHFADAQTLLNCFGVGNAFLGVMAVGMTFVILSGGIDLSVGAVVAVSTVLVAVLIRGDTFSVFGHTLPPVRPRVAIPVVLLIGVAFGAAQGSLIRFFDTPPFLITLAGLFLARGAGLVINPEQVQIESPFYTDWLANHPGLTVGHDRSPDHLPIVLSNQAIVYVAVLVVGIVVARFTRFGRATYAVGGNEQSATLLGLPVGLTKVGVYAVSGFCSALAGVLLTVDGQNGAANYAAGTELDTIAAVVVGGTILAGGSGSVLGTFFGALTFALLSTALTFDGRLVAAWNRIFVGGLLLAFILLQKAIQRRGRRA